MDGEASKLIPLRHRFATLEKGPDHYRAHPDRFAPVRSRSGDWLAWHCRPVLRYKSYEKKWTERGTSVSRNVTEPVHRETCVLVHFPTETYWTGDIPHDTFVWAPRQPNP